LALSAVLAAVLSSIPGAAPAQVFSDAKSASVDYSKADLAPRRSCESIAQYKSRDLLEVHAERIAAAATAPAFCRVTGVIAPEIAFEIALPERWNGRFYMIGNGGARRRVVGRPG
jgi:feruloyl esterase